MQTRIKIAIQKKGRLNSDSLDLLTRCGLKLRISQNTLLCHCENLPVDLLFVRDDDIPTLVMDDVCDLGIVGENVLTEKELEINANQAAYKFSVIKNLGFSLCRLSLAVPQEYSYIGYDSLQNTRIATSYPYILQGFLKKNKIQAEILPLSGSVEIAPRLGMADAICDLVSTGQTLEENHLKEVAEIFCSQAVIIKANKDLGEEKNAVLELLLRRINGVLRAKECKYVMFHAPIAALNVIKQILPGSENPTISPLEGNAEKVAVHVVTTEGVFWDTLEKLKLAGASSILVLPIEKMLD